MPGRTYTVKENQWISKIALEMNQHDGGEDLWNQNSHLADWTKNNRHVLDPGWVLKWPAPPLPGQRNIQTARSWVHKLPPSRKKQIVLTFYEHLGGSHPSVDCLVYVGNKLIHKDDSFTGKIVIPFIGKNDAVLIDETKDIEATIVVQVKRRGVKHGPPQKIKLHIGGLTPLAQQDGSISVKGLQKILTNLGYVPGKVDGIFGHRSQAAVRALQADHRLDVSGVPDERTVRKLVELVETPMRLPNRFPGKDDAVYTGANDPAVKPVIGTPIALGETEVFQKNALWDPYEAWIDRAAPAPEAVAKDSSLKAPYRWLKGDQTGMRFFDKAPLSQELPDRSFGGVPKEGIRFFPEEVYVAPSDDGDESNKNPIWMLKYRSVFLDCGGWIKDQLDFAVIYGWHAYLCSYIPKPDRIRALPDFNDGVADSPRIDYDFFQAMGNAVNVNACVSIVWADEREFDWRNITIIIPDVHFMTGETASIFKPNSEDVIGKYYDLRAELNLFAFAQEITSDPNLQTNVRIIQLGDTYDLWICSPVSLGSSGPLFRENKTSSVELEQASHIELASGGNYEYDKQKIAQMWKDAGGDPDFDPADVDMRIQVLRWWVEAIQGLRNSPVETAMLNGSPGKAPWVKWILDRRVGDPEVYKPYYEEQGRRVEAIRQSYRDGELTGNQVAEKLKADFPSQWEEVDDKPLMVGRWKVNRAEPDSEAVEGWLDFVYSLLGSDNRNASEKPSKIDSDELCAKYVKYVHSHLHGQWLNPGEAALRILRDKFGVQYLYGNHDNYLIIPDVPGSVCDQRVRFIEGKGVFIEHAHRLEPGLVGVASQNYDGCVGGFSATDGVVRYRADGILRGVSKIVVIDHLFSAVGEQADEGMTKLSQIYYRREAGRFFVSRSSMKDRLRQPLPHIFVIGHTHAPSLTLNYVHLNDAADTRGPGHGTWGNDGSI